MSSAGSISLTKSSDLVSGRRKKERKQRLIDKQRLAPDHAHGPLSRKAFENYLSQKKPYLDPDFKLTDMAEAMGVNRTVMSNFINQTYGMNFRRYLNQWRIEEYQILMAHPSNERKNPYRVMGYGGIQRLPPFPACDPIGKGGQGTAGRGTASKE